MGHTPRKNVTAKSVFFEVNRSRVCRPENNPHLLILIFDYLVCSRGGNCSSRPGAVEVRQNRRSMTFFCGDYAPLLF